MMKTKCWILSSPEGVGVGGVADTGGALWLGDGGGVGLAEGRVVEVVEIGLEGTEL
jgi:hypothetical protein